MTARPTPAERVGARAERARRGCLALQPWPPIQPAAQRPDPIGILEAQAATRVPELVPIRYGAHGRAHRSRSTAARPRSWRPTSRHATLRVRRAVLRRRPPLELRPLRLARAAAGVRRQRLRRDLPGPLGVGRQAAGGQHRGRGARRRLRRASGARSCSRPSRAYRDGDAGSRRSRPRRLVPRVDIDTLGPRHRRRGRREARRRAVERSRRRARATAGGAPQAHDRRSTASAHLHQAAADPPARTSSGPRRRRRRCSPHAARTARSTAATLDQTARLLRSPIELADFARKVVGVGSVGTQGLDRAAARPRRRDPLFLQIKEAAAVGV